VVPEGGKGSFKAVGEGVAKIRFRPPRMGEMEDDL
jgi:hypothetical protein